jgi:PAS domain S-box-containing protein
VIELVIEAMVDAVVVVDADGRITLANSGAITLTGFSREELRGLPISRLLIDESSGLRTVVRRRIEDGSILRREESWLVPKDGERIPVSITGSPVINDKGELHGIVLVARDVREVRQLLTDKEAEIARRRKAEEELRAAKASIESQLAETREQLLLAERRATLGTLAGGVGHELRNIAPIHIAPIDELALALADGGDATRRVREILPELERVGDHITQHGQRLMQLARPGPDRVAPIDLNEVVRDVEKMLRLAGKLRRVEIVMSVRGELTVTVNRTRIEQILVNLITNAVDAIGMDGIVTLATRESDDGKRAIVEVRDTGTGIDPEILGKIFEPFYTTKGPERGTGLGLPVVREIVASYGGNLTVDSKLGTGTTFRFDLPR